MLASTSMCGVKEEQAGDTNITNNETDKDTEDTDMEKVTENIEVQTEPETEAPTEHISPTETVTSRLGIQQTVDKKIKKTEGNNTIKLSLADFMQEGDIIDSFTFVIYSADNKDIGEFKGGCGISVTSDCPSATDEGWYQSDDFSAPTEGTYGEITWNVPADIKDYISPNGEILFGYWWGNSSEIRIENAICNITRTREIPCDGTAVQKVGESVGYNDTDNTIRVSPEILPEGAVIQAVTYDISSSGSLGKFTGAFGYGSSLGYYQSADIVSFTDSSDVSLTWILEPQARNYSADDGEIVLGYWWSEQSAISLDKITVKYSLGDGNGSAVQVPEKNKEDSEKNTAETGFRASSDIVKDIKVGWNLGNSLESYGTEKKGLSSETGWGNPKTTAEMIKSVKASGFNAIRVPVTWGEHMDGDTIRSEWLDRVQEVVDYAYDSGLYVILNMHHDDYIWFNPTEAEYAGDSARMKKIWSQIAERFRDYGDTLIFEGMNEPRTIDSPNEWIGGTADERAVVNKYAKDFVNTVRADGGNNSERSLIVTAYGACAEDVSMNDLVVPNDKHIIVSLHYYAPWKFAGGESTVFGDSEKSELDAKFDSMKKKFIDKGIPLIIDEFGCVGVADDNTRGEYYRYYISAAKSRGIKCFVWDNNVAKGTDGYRIFNRSKLEWNDTLLNGIMDGAK